MSKHVRMKLTCEIEFYIDDLDSDVPDQIRDMCGLDAYEAIEDDHIREYIDGLDVYELNDRFGIVSAEVEGVIVE